MAEEQAKRSESALQASVRRARELVLRNRAAGPNEIERANRSASPTLRQHGELATGDEPVAWLED